MSIQIKHRITGEVIFTSQAPSLRGANLSEADLSGAYLSEADLSGADLSGADLSGANLSGADLRVANLSVANLSEADLSGANLSGANLSGAYLREAKLSGADLSGAYLREAKLSGADLSEAKNVSSKALADNKKFWDAVPMIPNIHRTLLEAINRQGCALDMAAWHSCETTHCRAGWIVVLAGNEGRKLEGQMSTAGAARAIYYKSDPDCTAPNFYCGDAEAMADIIACAEREGAKS